MNMLKDSKLICKCLNERQIRIWGNKPYEIGDYMSTESYSSNLNNTEKYKWNKKWSDLWTTPFFWPGGVMVL